jgi:hypothetical protein
VGHTRAGLLLLPHRTGEYVRCTQRPAGHYDRTAVVVADTRPRVRVVAVPSGLRRAAAHQINAGINVRHVLHLAAQHTRARRAASWLRRAAVQAERRLLGYAMKLTQRRICDKPKSGPMRRPSLPSGQLHGGPRAALSRACEHQHCICALPEKAAMAPKPPATAQHSILCTCDSSDAAKATKSCGL